MQQQCLALSHHSSPPPLTIRSLLSTTLPGRHIQYMEGGSFQFDHHFPVQSGDKTCSSSEETLKDLLSTAPSEAHSQANKANNNSSDTRLIPLRTALDSNWRTTQTVSVQRRQANPVLKVDDPFELSLSSPLSGVEHGSREVQQRSLPNGARLPLVVDATMGRSGCHIVKPPSFCDALQCGSKRARSSGESPFLPPDS